MQPIDEKHKELYSQEAVRYDAHRFASRRGQLHHFYEVQAVHDLLGPLAGRRVLDIPAGTGRIAMELASRGAEIVAADLTPAMLRASRAKTSDIDLRYVNANGRQLPFPSGSFDAVLCIRFLHLILPSEWHFFIGELARVVKPDGVILVQLFNPFYGGPLALFREAYRRAIGQPGERFVWPWQERNFFTEAGLEVVSITSFWLPGMGYLGRPGSQMLKTLSLACTRKPLSWVAGPHMVLARRIS